MLNAVAIIKDRDTLCDSLEEEASILAAKGEGEAADQIYMAVVAIKQAVANAQHLAAHANERLEVIAVAEAASWSRSVLGLDSIDA
jgi:hypothetical protein